MGIYRITLYLFSCESREIYFEDFGKGREIKNHCQETDEFESKKTAEEFGWKIISEDKVFCPYCSKPATMAYIEEMLNKQ